VVVPFTRTPAVATGENSGERKEDDGDGDVVFGVSSDWEDEVFFDGRWVCDDGTRLIGIGRPIKWGRPFVVLEAGFG